MGLSSWHDKTGLRVPILNVFLLTQFATTVEEFVNYSSFGWGLLLLGSGGGVAVTTLRWLALAIGVAGVKILKALNLEDFSLLLLLKQRLD